MNKYVVVMGAATVLFAVLLFVYEADGTLVGVYDFYNHMALYYDRDDLGFDRHMILWDPHEIRNMTHEHENATVTRVGPWIHLNMSTFDAYHNQVSIDGTLHDEHDNMYNLSQHELTVLNYVYEEIDVLSSVIEQQNHIIAELEYDIAKLQKQLQK